MSLLDAATKDELRELYQAGDRHYHGIRHIEALLGLLERHRGFISDPDAVEAAIWFHDAIYDSRRKDNETASAALAAVRLAGKVDPARLDRIVAMIEATAAHRLEGFGDDDAGRDAALFLDMDLSILGARADMFDAYEAAVREEYGWVSDADWRSGRAAVLKTFLERPRLYFTDTFAAEFEAQARANIERSIRALEA